MTTDPFDILKRLIETVKTDTDMPCHEEIAALETVRSYYVPLELLPDGWKILELKFCIDDGVHGFNCELSNFQRFGNKRTGYSFGTTPNAAFLAAVEAIGDV